jgi:hypothetical protein
VDAFAAVDYYAPKKPVQAPPSDSQQPNTYYVRVYTPHGAAFSHVATTREGGRRTHSLGQPCTPMAVAMALSTVMHATILALMGANVGLPSTPMERPGAVHHRARQPREAPTTNGLTYWAPPNPKCRRVQANRARPLKNLERPPPLTVAQLAREPRGRCDPRQHGGSAWALLQVRSPPVESGFRFGVADGNARVTSTPRATSASQHAFVR